MSTTTSPVDAHPVQEAPPLPAWSRLWPYAALSGGTLLLAATGVLPVWPGLVHLVALPPLDLFTDLRVLLVHAPSWEALAVLLVGLLAVRVLVMAWALGGIRPPLVLRALRFYLLLAVPLALAAFVITVAHTVLYSRLFWPGVGVVVVAVLVLGPGPWRSGNGTGLRHAWREGLRVDVTVPYLAVLAVLGVVAEAGDLPTLAMVPLSGLATALAVRRLAAPPRAPVAWLTTVVVLVGAAAVVFLLTRDTGPMPEDDPPREGALLLMSGINSSSGRGAIFDTSPERLGFTCEQTFYVSYAGPGDGQPRGTATCPITTGAPYEPHHTQRPVDEQVEAFAAQVEDLPRPLTVATHSHGAWIVWDAVAQGLADVDVLVLVGPFPHSVVGYAEAGSHGSGAVLGHLLGVIGPAAAAVDFHFDPRAPAAQDLLGTAGRPQEVFSRPVGDGVRTLAVHSATDLPLLPEGWRMDVDRNACPARVAHPYLPISPPYYREISAFLDQEPAPSCPAWRDWGGLVVRPLGPPPSRM
ncbi:hypothetical protein [Cellulomonas bogoriensis]|uniref:Membrane protein n=1 Tax=Cellulomonas bogoriensis 69B4 = DSM 16987 TaxID=1386082 RepID=A0A0A0BY44_9CELL|nr:hypothetical protein [Cellulomonas bogoriensis]KGM13293.1 membrane protein [Cellulomonas bogoriensis 69B4 = DSM 16987]